MAEKEKSASVDPGELARMTKSLGELTKTYEAARESAPASEPSPKK